MIVTGVQVSEVYMAHQLDSMTQREAAKDMHVCVCTRMLCGKGKCLSMKKNIQDNTL